MRYLEYTVLFLFLFITNCTPFHARIDSRTLLSSFEGFTDSDTFQVICNKHDNQELTTENLAKTRDDFLKSCKDHLVVTLARFKIAYDYNTQIIASRSPAARNAPASKGRPGSQTVTNTDEITVETFGYDIVNRESLIKEVNQLDFQVTPELVSRLNQVYAGFLPGRVMQEGYGSGQPRLIYAVHKPGLMQTIKNTPLPFGVEISR